MVRQHRPKAGKQYRYPDDEYAEAARLFSDGFPGLALDAAAWFEQRGPVPHKRTAVAFLHGLAARALQEDVTR